ncbi:CPBP family intramembrane metalloprotease [Rossellomorea vietnamensis]|uniref:CPBP family intramembrane metalloprotease n=1 Tax=Rossellomorea vietnamensis TaxID=218284 RepID=A0A5D4MHU9_9BACI|nr:MULTISPECIES: CPBP family intramembrane glutamic endopeptidase [Bacillaceae]TYS00581.1 CPBP family intramembrane metalloprotease [Rossellomorea vietnamensis]
MKSKQKDLVMQITDRELTFHLYATQIVLLTSAIILGIFLYDDISTFINQFVWNRQILVYGAGSGMAIVLLDLLFMKVLPKKYYDDGGINERIFRNRSVMHIFFLAAVISVCEELLFRGVIQYHFGFITATVIFAVVHIRYWGNWFLVINIVLLSTWIGLVYEWTANLAVTMVMHFVIDFLLGLTIKYQAENQEKRRDVL